MEQTSVGQKRAADEPVEEMDAARALQPEVEETKMEIGVVENLKHILELELCTEDNLESDFEGLYSDDGLDWWPLEKVRRGDLKELQGLFDKGVLRLSSEETRSDGKQPRYISSKIVRKTKGEDVKSRMCLRDFNRGRPEGGKLLAATPSLMALKLLLTIASWLSSVFRDYICLIGDVTQAFVHAPIDEMVRTRVPDSLDGLETGHQSSLKLLDQHIQLLRTNRVRLVVQLLANTRQFVA